MRRITLTVVAILLAVPAAASAKVGIEFAQDPATVAPGKKMPLTIIILREPKDPLNGQMKPAVGAHPLVTFRSKSGRVVRVRGHASDAGGISKASVALPDRGPWMPSLSVPGVKLAEGGGEMGSFELAAAAPAVKQVAHPPKAAAPATGNGGLSTGWILLGGLAALAGLTLTAIRTGLPARLRTRLGGGGA